MRSLVLGVAFVAACLLSLLVPLWAGSLRQYVSEYSLFPGNFEEESNVQDHHVGHAEGATVTLFGQVRLPSGKGLPNARIRITGEGYEGPEFTFTDSSGAYRFKNVPSGHLFRLTVRANGTAFHEYSREVMAGGGDFSIDFLAK